MIRATRNWGGRSAQGRAFGVLDGGRGLVAAVLASLGVFAFSLFFPEQAENVTATERRDALTAVIYLFTFAVFASALSCWIVIPDSTPGCDREKSSPLTGLGDALRESRIWLQALVVICAYCGYKGLDNYSLYAVQALGMDELEAGKFTAACAYIRPVAAIASGFLTDRFSARKVIAGLFLLLIVSYGILAQFAPSPELLGIIYGNLLVSYFAVYGLRGVYFALLEESKIPSRYTGAAVGVISFIGYTPDAFFAPIAGRLLDQNPGTAGHQHVFALLAGIATLGTIAIGVLMRLSAARSSENTT
jgi:nitrate/nitrite transporter NarK